MPTPSKLKSTPAVQTYIVTLHHTTFDDLLCKPNSLRARRTDEFWIALDDVYPVLINGYRQCSFSAYGLRRDGVRLVPDLDILNTISGLVERMVDYDARFQVDIDRNRDYGIVIVHEKKASKSTGVIRLQNRLGMSEVVLIGDGDSAAISVEEPEYAQSGMRAKR